MAPQVRQVTTRADLRRFVRVPGQLAADDPHWVEPLMMERLGVLSPKQNPLFEHAEAAHFIAEDDGRILGRISAVMDRLAPQADGGLIVGHFGMIDARDHAALSALFATAETWLKDRGAQVVRGPFSLSINEITGLLIDGFDTAPFVMMDHHAPWLGDAVERQGYSKAKDTVAYLLDLTVPLPDKERRVIDRPWPGLVVRNLNPKAYAQEIATITDVFNDAWAGNWGFAPLTEAETAAMARDLKPILDPGLVKIAELDGQPAAFLVLLPNINEAIADLGGRLLPFGWARLLWRLKVSGVKTGRVPLMGVRREVAATMAGKLLPLRLIYAVDADARARGIEEIEMSWLLEDNWPIRRMVEGLGGRLSKTYRVYEKTLA
ncbi:MAG: dATP pyrophosphohydrolase [Pseudomonadota bacterium]